MKKALITILVLLSNYCYCQTNTLKVNPNPDKRLKSITNYISKDLGIPSILSDSTVTLINKDLFYYDDKGRVIKIISSFYKSNQEFKVEQPSTIHIDSILYIKQNFITRIKTESKDGEKTIVWQREEKLIDYKKIINTLPCKGQKIVYFEDDRGASGKAELRASNCLIENIMYKSQDDSGNIKILYSKQKYVTKIGKTLFVKYLDSNYRDFKIVNHSGSLSSVEYYYFDSDGFLISKISEEDTNPRILIYEYEAGSGNASSFVYSIYDLLRLKPMIY